MHIIEYNKHTYAYWSIHRYTNNPVILFDPLNSITGRPGMAQAKLTNGI